MKMTHADIVAYPRFARYVRKSIPEIIHVRPIVRAMQEIGQINRATLQRAVKWGQGPDINITPLAGAYGQFTPNVGSNEIRIDKGVVEDFEAGRGVRRTSRGRKVFLVGVTLLHELIHWGDDKDGIDRPGEEGNEFEIRIYGKIIG